MKVHSALTTLHAFRDTLVTTASPDEFEYGLNRLVEALRPGS